MKIAVMCTSCDRLLFLEQDAEQWRELHLRLPSSCPDGCHFQSLVIRIENRKEEEDIEEDADNSNDDSR